MIPYHAKKPSQSIAFLMHKTEQFLQRLIPGAGLQVEELVSVNEDGIVYKVRARAIEATLCTRMVPRRAQEDPSWRRDVRAMSQVRNPFLATLYRVVETPAATVILSEWVDHPRLETWVTTVGKLSPKEVIRLGLQVACALGEYHETGAAHGQVTARNIAMLNARGSVTRTLLLDCSPTRGKATQKEDVRALGEVLHFAATGARANGTDMGALMTLPPNLADAIATMLVADEETGPKTCGEVVRKLSAIRRRINLREAEAAGAPEPKPQGRPKQRTLVGMPLAKIEVEQLALGKPDEDCH